MHGDAPLYQVEDGKADKAQAKRYKRLRDDPTTKDAGDQGVLQNQAVIDAVFADLAHQAAPHLVLYFHGGLVSAPQARESVVDFNAALHHHGLTPLLWAWNSDAWTEIRDDVTTVWNGTPADTRSRWQRMDAYVAAFFKKARSPFWVRAWRRWRGKRDHGVLATLLEEFARGNVVGGVIRHLWNLMKTDIREAFDTEAEHRAGLYFLQRLKAYAEQPHPYQAPLKVSLIGHSAGALYICELLKAAAALEFDFVFDHLIFWAPGVDFTTFDQTILRHRDHFKTFTMFALRDEWERTDALTHPYDRKQWLKLYFYPRSLLYLVAGLLEGGKDGITPLVGMQHYLESDTDGQGAPVDASTYQRIRNFLIEGNRVVWSPTMTTHGGFIKDTRRNGTIAATLKLLEAETIPTSLTEQSSLPFAVVVASLGVAGIERVARGRSL